MGCSGSKDTQTTPQQGAPSPPPKQTQSQTKSQQNEKDEEPWASKERTIAFIQKELNINETSANKIYDRVNKDGDKEMDPEEVKSLMALIDECNKELKPKFEEADTNKCGKVKKDKAAVIIKEAYPDMLDGTRDKLVNQFDNGDGTITYGEYIFFHFYLKDAETKLKPQFAKCDTNKTGTVTLTEASNVLEEVFPNLEKRAIKRILYRQDSGDAIVQYYEFILFYAKLKGSRARLSRKFDELDADNDGKLQRSRVLELVVEETGMDEDDCKSLVYEEDEDNSGNISKQEFLDLWGKLFG